MKRILLGLAAALLATSALTDASAQNVLDKGSSVFNIGVGLNNTRSSNYFTVLGSWDYGVVGNLWDAKSALSLGVQGAFYTGESINGFSFGPTLGLHYHFIPQLDTYARLMLGYEGWSYKNSAANDLVDAVDGDHGGFGWNFSVGARYMFTPNIGAFLELGYGSSVANVGVAFSI